VSKKMKQEEVLVLKRGRVKLGKGTPKIIGNLGKEKMNLFFVLTEFASMPRQTKLHDTDVSFFPEDIFKDMIAERIIIDARPIDVFNEKMQELCKKTSGIMKFQTKCENGKIELHVFIKEPNWELEDHIYNVYGDLLERFPTFSFDLEVKELFS